MFLCVCFPQGSRDYIGITILWSHRHVVPGLCDSWTFPGLAPLSRGPGVWPGKHSSSHQSHFQLCLLSCDILKLIESLTHSLLFDSSLHGKFHPPNRLFGWDSGMENSVGVISYMLRHVKKGRGWNNTLKGCDGSSQFSHRQAVMTHGAKPVLYVLPLCWRVSPEDFWYLWQ